MESAYYKEAKHGLSFNPVYHKLTEVLFVYVNMYIIFKILAVVQNKSNFV